MEPQASGLLQGNGGVAPGAFTVLRHLHPVLFCAAGIWTRSCSLLLLGRETVFTALQPRTWHQEGLNKW